MFARLFFLSFIYSFVCLVFCFSCIAIFKLCIVCLSYVRLHHSGPAQVDNFFFPEPHTEPSCKGLPPAPIIISCLQMLILHRLRFEFHTGLKSATFRGRCLVGQELTLPKGVSGRAATLFVFVGIQISANINLSVRTGYVFEDRMASSAEIGSSEANHTAFDQRRSFVAQSHFKKLTYWYPTLAHQHA